MSFLWHITSLLMLHSCTPGKAGFTTGLIGPVPGGDASKEALSTTSSLAISDEPVHQHQPDKTENSSPTAVTDTYSSAPPPPNSPTPLETETEAGASEAAEGGRDPEVTGFSIVQDGIVDSDVSIPHSRPYMAYIRDSTSKAVCGGFLVREDFVMTAAHCKGSHLKVYLGVNDTKFLPDGVDVLPFPHPQFKSNTPGHDIMLLKLETSTNLNKAVHTITLPTNSSENISKDCMVMGWGLQKSNVLKEANVTLLYSKNCGTPDTLCSEGTTGPAEGDSGGPLVCGDVAQGISSYYNKQESNGEYRTRYTDISQYLPWIHNVMNTQPQQKNEISKGKLEEHEEEEHEVIKFNTICLV